VRLEAADDGYAIADAIRFTPAAEQPTLGGLHYVHPDHLGTPRAITRLSDNALVWRWENAEPFGDSQPNENPSGLGAFAYNLRFPGQYFDQETGTHYNYYRDYSPAIGRYIQSDPIGLRGGLNTYLYVDGAPLKKTDPTGLFPPGADPECFRRGECKCVTAECGAGLPPLKPPSKFEICVKDCMKLRTPTCIVTMIPPKEPFAGFGCGAGVLGICIAECFNKDKPCTTQMGDMQVP